MRAAFAVIPARSDEIDDLARLHAACFVKPWAAGAFARLLAAPGAFALIGRCGEDLAAHAGFALARTATDESEILTIGVLPDYRRRGLARELMTAVAARALADGVESLFLEVDRQNRAALALYRDLGFAEVARRPGYYRQADGRHRDALVMRLSLTS